MATQESLNPPHIKTGGIRMLPVCGGKFKVWTKRMGPPDAKLKVLLLHGGPGFNRKKRTYAPLQVFPIYL